MIKANNEQIKSVIERENIDHVFEKSIEDSSAIYDRYSTTEKGMNVLYGFVNSLIEVSEFPEINIDLDLTYKTIEGLLPAIAYEFMVGCNSGYSFDENIDIAEKTIAAYLMFLCANEHDYQIKVTKPDICNPNIDWSGMIIKIDNGTKSYDMLDNLRGCVKSKNGVIVIEIEKIIRAYQSITAVDLKQYKWEDVRFELK